MTSGSPSPDRKPGRTSASRFSPASLLAAVAVVLLVLMAAAYFGRPEDFGDFPKSPESDTAGSEDENAAADRCLTEMLDAAREGNVEVYVECFTGELRGRLQGRVHSRGREPIAAELAAREADLKNFVTSDWGDPAAEEKTCVLERTYSDHQERHRARLRRVGEEWKIVAIVPLEAVTQRIEYGTPVVPIEPEDESGGNRQP